MFDEIAIDCDPPFALHLTVAFRQKKRQQVSRVYLCFIGACVGDDDLKEHPPPKEKKNIDRI